MKRPKLETEWHHYKSGRTGHVVGSYFYLPELSDKNLAHVYKAGHGGAHWYATSFVPGVSFKGQAFHSRDVAERAVTLAMCEHYNLNRQKAFDFVQTPF